MNPTSHVARLTSTVIGFVIVSAQSGCTNLAAVRQFAKMSAATADYRVIVTDYATSPARRAKFEPLDQRPELERKIDERAKQKVRLVAAQQVLVDYMSALGDLAADDLVDTTSDFKSLQEAVTGLPFFKEGESETVQKTGSAAAALAGIITNAILDGWRQHKVRRIVTDSNAHVVAVIDGLNDIVTKEFAASLNVEQRSVDACFESAISAAERVKIQPVIEPIVAGMPEDIAKRARDAAERVRVEQAVAPIAVLLQSEESERVATMRGRLEEYSQVLKEIKMGHQKLAANVDKMKGKELIEYLKARANQLKAAYAAIKDLST